MTIDETIATACEAVPGLVHGALALLPEGILIGGIGEGGAFEREPLVRSAARVLGNHAGAAQSKTSAFVEYAYVSHDQLVVIERGHEHPRVALVLVCTREPNLALVLSTAREALKTLEHTLDLAEWES
jgi:hypothetical protein